MKKILFSILSFLLLLPFISPCYAESTEAEYTYPANVEHSFEFRDFTYTENVPSDCVISFESYVETESYILKDKQGTIIEKLTVEYPVSTSRAVNPNAHTAYFTRDHKILGNGKDVLTVRFTACVLYYSSGSFRSFEAVQYGNLAIASSITPMALSNTSASAWSHTGTFPCTQIDYSYTSNVYTTGSVSVGIGGQLINAGFSSSSNYYRLINGNGSISLY